MIGAARMAARAAFARGRRAGARGGAAGVGGRTGAGGAGSPDARACVRSAAVGGAARPGAPRGRPRDRPGPRPRRGSRRALVAALAREARAVVLDADALVAFQGALRRASRAGRGGPLVLTPHPGEFRTLFPELAPGSASSIRGPRPRRAAAASGATLLLKGVPTVIARDGRPPLTVAAGNPGLATGGSGDVLSGIVGTALAQGLAPEIAAAFGAQALGRAADLAARRSSARTLRPMDVVAALAGSLAGVGGVARWRRRRRDRRSCWSSSGRRRCERLAAAGSLVREPCRPCAVSPEYGEGPRQTLPDRGGAPERSRRSLAALGMTRPVRRVRSPTRVALRSRLTRCASCPPSSLCSPRCPLRAQSPSRDWRPEDRTVIGDFSRITAVATSIDRVYAASPSQVLIWNPQFQQWQGPYDPPDPQLLTRVTGALVDPLDNSLWLARRGPAGCTSSPSCSSGTRASSPAACRRSPSTRTTRRPACSSGHGRAGCCCRAAAIAPSPTRAPARPVSPARVDDVLRSNPTLQANAAQILIDAAAQRRPLHRPPPARSTTSAGTSAPPGVGLLYLPDGAALPERLPFGLRSPVAGAVFGWPDGVWAATDRTPLAEAALTFVASDLKAFRSLQGLPAAGLPFNQVPEARGAGLGALGRDRPRRRADRHRTMGGSTCSTRRAGLPDGVVYAVVSRQGRITVGTRRGVARVDDSLRIVRIAPRFADPALAVFPTGDSVWVGTQRGLLLALPGTGGRGAAAPRSRSPALQAPVVALGALGDTVVALTRDQLLWRDPRHAGLDARPQPERVSSAGCVAFAADGPGFWVAGERGVGFARLSTPAAAPAPRGRPAGAEQRPRRGRRVSSGSPPTPAWCASGSTPSGRDRAARAAAGERARPRARVRPHPRASPRRWARAAPAWATTARCSRPPTRCWCASTDVSVEGVHFRPRLAVARGDRLARGRRGAVGPRGGRRRAGGVLVALTVPSDGTDDDVASRDGAVPAPRRRTSARTVVGGDLSAGPAWSLGVTVLGWASAPVTRAGALPGRRRSGSPARSAVRARRSRPGSAGRSPTPRRAAGSRGPCRGSHAGRWLAPPRRARDARPERRPRRRRRPPRRRVGRRARARPRARAGRGGGGRGGAPGWACRRSSSRRRAARTTSCWWRCRATFGDARTRAPSRASRACRSPASARCGPAPASAPTARRQAGRARRVTIISRRGVVDAVRRRR